jgi:hypothetical protein
LIPALLMLAACNPQTQLIAALETPVAQAPTLSIPPQRPTLPPTWTPTSTETPAPPTPTRTPTRPPTLTPTPAAGDICAALEIQSALDEDGRYFPWDGKIAIAIQNNTPDVIVRFLAVHRLTGDNKGFQIPGGGLYLVDFRVDLLPRPGLYDWTLSAISDSYGEICTQSGYFFIGRPEWENAPDTTFETTPESEETPDDL